MEWRGHVACLGESRDMLNEVANIWQPRDQRVARYYIFYGYQNDTHNIRGCTNPVCLVTMAPKFCVVAQRLWALSVEVFHVTL